jgi:hypothetical protein
VAESLLRVVSVRYGFTIRMATNRFRLVAWASSTRPGTAGYFAPVAQQVLCFDRVVLINNSVLYFASNVHRLPKQAGVFTKQRRVVCVLCEMATA